jgi:HK97 family phage portal protein
MNTAARLTKFGALKAEIDAARMPEFLMDRAESAAWDLPDMGVFENQARLYTRLSWVYSAVTIVGQSCALQALNIKKYRGERTKDIDNHPFELLLGKPNPLQSRFEFLRDTVSYSAINGNSYWWLNRTDPNQQPTEMWLLPSWRVKPKPNGKMYLEGYEYDPGVGQETRLLPLHQVVHFKKFNPMSEFIGLSAVEPVAIAAQTDLASQQWSSKFYGKNNARLPGILAFKDQINNEIAWERIKSDTAYAAGTRNLLLLRGVGDRVDWLKAAANQSEMQMVESRQFTKEEIYSVFAPGLASMLDITSTEANSITGKQTFLEFTIWPRLVSIAQKITLDILPAYGRSLVAEFDDPRQTDRQIELLEQEAYAQTHTLNEIRAEFYEDDPLPDERGNWLPAQLDVPATIPLMEKQEKPEEPPAPAAPPVQLVLSSDAFQNETPDEPETEETEEQEQAAMRADLAAWRRKSLKSLKANKGAAVTFESKHIDPDLHADVWARLSACKSAADVREVFEQVMAGGQSLALADQVKALTELVHKSAWVMYP